MALDFERLDLFQELLERGLCVRVRATGRSMQPFLQGGEVVTIKKVPVFSLRRGDVVLCRFSDGFALVHRIIRIWRQDNGRFTLQTQGDGLLAPDQVTSDQEVLGKVCVIERMSPAGGCLVRNIESKAWQIISRFMAWMSLIRPKFPVLGRLIYKLIPCW
jgi:signal peptidase I